MVESSSRDTAIRLAAFDFLLEQSPHYQGGVLPWDLLREGFPFEGDYISMLGAPGIWKPRQMSLPLSIRTTPRKPGQEPKYDDRIDDQEILHYHYFRTEPLHHYNVGLREAAKQGLPLIYFRGVVEGWYLPVWPVLIVGEETSAHTFRLDLRGRQQEAQTDLHIGDMAVGPERKYTYGSVRKRVHQREFHRMVLAAYRTRCSVCLLRHDRLLDASHILPDTHPLGDPVVPNGIALCKLHHAAYDANIIGVSPSLEIEIRRDVLEEKDGPMLVHGLQGFQGGSLCVPREEHLRPNREFLAERYEMFRQAG